MKRQKHKQVSAPAQQPRVQLSLMAGSSRVWNIDRRDLLVLGALILLAWVLQSFFLNYTVDDAFISFRYSRNLAQGEGLVFNPGERVEGFTNFLWTVYCAIPFLLGIDVLWFSKLSLMLLAAGSLVLMVLLARQLFRGYPWWFAFLPAVLLATHTSFTVYAVNGMETVLFVFLLLWALLVTARETVRGGWLSAILWVLLFFTRPDGMLFFGLAWLVRFIFFRRAPGFWTWTLVFGGAALVFTVFRLLYFGHLFPNTYYVKSAGTLVHRVSGWGRRYFEDMLKVAANWFYLFVPLLGLLVMWRRMSWFVRLLFVLPYVYLAYVLYIGGDVNFPHFRFLLHVLPFMATAIFLLFAEQKRKGRETGDAVRATVAVVLTGIVVLLQLDHTRSVWRELNRTPESPGYRYLQVLPLAGTISIYPEIADSLKKICPQGSRVVMQDVGAIPFYSGVKTIDIIGLVNRDLAHYYHRMRYSDYLRGRLPLETVQEVDAYVRDYILEQVRAEYVLYHVDSGDENDLRYSFHFHNLAFDPRFQRLYQPLMVFRYPVTNRADHILFARVENTN